MPAHLRADLFGCLKWHWPKDMSLYYPEKKSSGVIVLLIAAVSMLACSPDPGYQSIQGSTMGTYYRVQYKSTPQCQVSQASIDKLLVDFNLSLSTYLPNSEISLFNNRLDEKFYPVSARFSNVLMAANMVWEQSGGAFDVTVGPLVNLWGFGPQESAAFPSVESQVKAFEAVGMQYLELRRARAGGQTRGLDSVSGENFGAYSVSKKVPNLYLDFSALAKGLGVDEIAHSVKQTGCADFMVDIGGEVRTLGFSPKARPWRIGIEAPDATRRGMIQRVLELSGHSVATSGDYRNFREVDGVRVDHVIDPRTGKPADNTVVSVSVVHEDAMWADAYATTFMVLGAEEGIRAAENLNLAVLVITKTSDDRFVERYTPAMTSFFVDFPE